MSQMLQVRGCVFSVRNADKSLAEDVPLAIPPGFCGTEVVPEGSLGAQMNQWGS